MIRSFPAVLIEGQEATSRKLLRIALVATMRMASTLYLLPPFIGIVTLYIFLLLHLEQTSPVEAAFPSYERAGLGGAVWAWNTAPVAPTACYGRLSPSPTNLLSARRGAMAAATSFVRQLQNTATALADKLTRWACATQASGNDQQHHAVRQLSLRFHTAVTQLLAIVDSMAGSHISTSEPAVESLHGSASTKARWRDGVHWCAANNSANTEEKTEAHHPANQVLLPVSSRSFYMTMSRSTPHGRRLAVLAQEKHVDRVLAVPLVNQREALCNISMHWNITDWQVKCAQGSAITNAWDGVGYSNVNGAVTALTLSEKRLNGTLPVALSAFLSLEHLQLDNNAITGALSPSLSVLSALTFLDMANNRISGSIPQAISGLSALEHLNIPMNRIRGTVPVEIAGLAALTFLGLNNNELSGTIPRELSTLTGLSTLYLFRNQLRGAIPKELSALTGLSTLYLFTNQLTGTIPKELSALTLLEEFSPAGNKLTGSIPGELGALVALTALWLNVNQLQGVIPGELSLLSDLRILRLNENRLSGTIPVELSALSRLVSLHLFTNHLNGTIPKQLSELVSLGDLSLADNQLHGALPKELGALAKVGSLWLNMNQLSGTVPGELSSLTLLSRLYLYGNRLSGIIPLSLSALSNLQRLEITDTQIHGVASGLQQWLTSLAILAAARAPLLQPSCGGYPDVLYDISHRVCVATNFLPSSDGACRGVASLNASTVLPQEGASIANVPPTGLISSFLRFKLPAPCRYSSDYHLVSIMDIYRPSDLGTSNSEAQAETEESSWLNQTVIALPEHQAFLGDVSGLIPLWSNEVWNALARGAHTTGADGYSAALEMRTALNHVSPWHIHVSLPEEVAAVLDEEAAVPEEPFFPRVVQIPPCSNGTELLAALKAACPPGDICSSIAFASSGSCSNDYRPVALPQQHQHATLVTVTSVSLRMYSEPPSPPHPGSSAALFLGTRPLQQPLPDVYSMLSTPNTSAVDTLLLPRQIHCLPWVSVEDNHSVPMMFYGEVLLPHQQSILSLTNATTTILDTTGAWPAGASLVSLWPNGRIAQRGTQLGPSYSNVAPLPTPALLSLAALIDVATKAIRLHVWVNGTFHTSISFSSLGPGVLDNMHLCISNAHSEEPLISSWHLLEDAFYEHDAARLLGGDDLQPTRTLMESPFLRLPWRSAEAQLWSQLALPETVVTLLSWASSEADDLKHDERGSLVGPSSSMGLTLINVEANFTGLVFHCFLQPAWAMRSDAACLTILTGSHVLFQHSTFVLHPSASNNSTESSQRDGPQGPVGYQSLIFIHNAAVSFVDCRFSVAQPLEVSPAAWSSSQGPRHNTSLPVFLRTAYDAKALRAGCRSMYQHDWRRAAPPVFQGSRQQQCLDFLSHQQEEDGKEEALHHNSRAYRPSEFVVSLEACQFATPAGWSAATILARGPLLLRRTTFIMKEEMRHPRDSTTSSVVQNGSMVRLEEMHNWNTGFGAVLMLGPVDRVSPELAENTQSNGSNSDGYVAGTFLQGWSLRDVLWVQDKDKSVEKSCVVSEKARFFLHDCTLQVPDYKNGEASPILLGPAWLQNVTLLAASPQEKNQSLGEEALMIGYLTGVQISSITTKKNGMPDPAVKENATVGTVVKFEGVIANEPLSSAMSSTVAAMEGLMSGMASDRLRQLPVMWHIRCGMLLLTLPARYSRHWEWEVASLAWSVSQASLLSLADESTSFSLAMATVRDATIPAPPPWLHDRIFVQMGDTSSKSPWSRLPSLAPLTLLAYPGGSTSMQDVLFHNTACGTAAALVMGLSPKQEEANLAPGYPSLGNDGLNASVSRLQVARAFFFNSTGGGVRIGQESSASWLRCHIADTIFQGNSVLGSGGGLLLHLMHQHEVHHPAHTALSVVIENSTFLENHAVRNGGGLAIEIVEAQLQAPGQSPFLQMSLSTVLLQGNSAEQEGGALYAAGPGVHVALDATVVERNLAIVKGGAVTATQGASLALHRGYCRSNQALSSEGGCMMAYGMHVQASVDTSLFSFNAAPTGGGVAVTDGATLYMSATVLTAGRGHFGAGALLRGSSSLFHGSVLANNTASGCGAGMAALTANVSVASVVTRWNEASDCGGGFYLYASVANFFNGSRLGPGNAVGDGAANSKSSAGGAAVMLLNRGSLLYIDHSSAVVGNGRLEVRTAALQCDSDGSIMLEAPRFWWGHNIPYDVHVGPSCTTSIEAGTQHQFSASKAIGTTNVSASLLASGVLLALLRHAVEVAEEVSPMAPSGDVRLLPLPPYALPPGGASNSTLPVAAACVPACLRLYVGQQEVSQSVALQSQEDGSMLLTYAVPHGSGTGVPVTLFLQGQAPVPEPLEVLHYAAPILTDIAPSILPRAGGLLTVWGRHFGISRFPAADVAIMIGSRPCSDLRVWNDTMMSCVAPGQTGASLEVLVTVGGQVAEIEESDTVNASAATSVTSLLRLPQVDPPGSVTILSATPVATELEQQSRSDEGVNGNEDSYQRYNVLPDALDVTLELKNGDTGGIPLQSYAVRLSYAGGANDGNSFIIACPSVSCRLPVEPSYGQRVQLEAAALTQVYSIAQGNAVFGGSRSLALAWPPLPLAREDLRFLALTDGVNMTLPVVPVVRASGSSSPTPAFPHGGAPPIAVAVAAFGSWGGGDVSSCILLLLPGYSQCAPLDASWQGGAVNEPCPLWDNAAFRGRCPEETLDIMEVPEDACRGNRTSQTCTIPLPEALVPGASYSMSLVVATAAAWSTWTTPVERGIPCTSGQGITAETPVERALQGEGRSGNAYGDVRCHPCTPGSYQAADRSDAEATRCLRCPPGTVQPLPGQAVCITCPAGSYADTGQETCLPCPLGSYGPMPGLQHNCLECASGWYTAQEGSVACTPCPASGVQCKRGLLHVLPGYWRPSPPPLFPTLSLSNTSQLFRCPNPDACRAVAVDGVQQSLNGSLFDQGDHGGHHANITGVLRKVLFVHECDAPYTGPVCGVCAPGYARLGAACTECWDSALNAVMLLLSVLTMCVLSVVLIVRSRRAKSLSSMLVRLLLDYLQLTWITGEFAARGPALFREILGFTSLSNGVSLDISFAHCGMSSSYALRFGLYMGLPLLVPAAVAAGIVIHRSVRYGVRSLWSKAQCRKRLYQRFQHCCTSGSRNGRIGFGEPVARKHPFRGPRLRLFNTRVFVSASLILLVLLHSRVTREVFAAFRCYSEPVPSVEGGAAQYYLRAQLDEVCYRGWRMVLAGAVGLLFVVGLPLGILLMLYRPPYTHSPWGSGSSKSRRVPLRRLQY